MEQRREWGRYRIRMAKVRDESMSWINWRMKGMGVKLIGGLRNWWQRQKGQNEIRNGSHYL